MIKGNLQFTIYNLQFTIYNLQFTNPSFTCIFIEKRLQLYTNYNLCIYDNLQIGCNKGKLHWSHTEPLMTYAMHSAIWIL